MLFCAKHVLHSTLNPNYGFIHETMSITMQMSNYRNSKCSCSRSLQTAGSSCQLVTGNLIEKMLKTCIKDPVSHKSGSCWTYIVNLCVIVLVHCFDLIVKQCCKYVNQFPCFQRVVCLLLTMTWLRDDFENLWCPLIARTLGQQYISSKTYFSTDPGFDQNLRALSVAIPHYLHTNHSIQ